jgi:hypothetical protein
MQMPLGKQQPINSGHLDQPPTSLGQPTAASSSFPERYVTACFRWLWFSKQQTELNPTEIMTDTGAYTDVAHGCCFSSATFVQRRLRPQLDSVAVVVECRIV